MSKISKKTFKRALSYLSSIAFIALCVYNIKLGLSDYNKNSGTLFTLEALANGEGSGSSETILVQCCSGSKPSDIQGKSCKTSSYKSTFQYEHNRTEVLYCCESGEQKDCNSGVAYFSGNVVAHIPALSARLPTSVLVNYKCKKN
jgi:hypothetical protein